MSSIIKVNTMEKSRILLVVQDFTGHSEVELKWNKNDNKSKNDMKEMFMELKNQGYIFFKINTKLGILKTKGEIVSEWDENEGKLFAEKNPDWKPEKAIQNEIIQKMVDGRKIEVTEVEEESESFEEAVYFDPEKNELEEDSKYIATHPITGG